MLASEEYVAQHFQAENFIFIKPKDIVSGDFYWALSHHGKILYCSRDCTDMEFQEPFASLLNISF